MSRVRRRGEEVRRFILENVREHPTDIARVAAQRFGITRQAVNKHVKRLVEEEALEQEGKTRSRRYRLRRPHVWKRDYPLGEGLTEDQVWSQDVRPQLLPLSDNAMEIWAYGVTEMVNNAIDHSEGKELVVHLRKSAVDAEIILLDDGVGIFKKIQEAMGLLDERHAVLELAKGKFTTDPGNHTGEGIFFASRVFDAFSILSGDVFFSHDQEDHKDWIMKDEPLKGTGVSMILRNHTARSLTQVFDRFSSKEMYSFDRTVVPVRLAEYGDGQLISRSQAKRLLVRFDRFHRVILDFKGVDSIGQAFADEVFRVFAARHPEIEIDAIHEVPAVARMISRARAARTGGQ